jgi:hypothetical protein
MKNLSCAVAVSMALALAVPVYAAEPEVDVRSCGYWLSRPDAWQNAFLGGWLDALHVADGLTGDEIVSKMWPKGHRVGGVRIEVTLACRRNHKWNIGTVISVIAHELNGVPLPEPQSSTPYTRF